MQLAGYDQLSTLMTGRTEDLYRARDVANDRWVALKVFRFKLVDDHDERLFRANCERAVDLSAHPHVVDLYDVGITDNRHPFLVMELVEGATVAHRLRHRSETFGPDEAVAMGATVAGALQAAHETGAVHGMLSPASIMLTGDGRPRLADLGIGMLEERWEAAGHLEDVVPYHAAPEVIERGAPGPASDVYSLAATVYAMLAGHAPHEVGSVDSVSAHLLRILQGTVPRLPADAPPALDRALQEAMAAYPEERTATAAAFAQQLKGALAPPERHDAPDQHTQQGQNGVNAQPGPGAPVLLSGPASDPQAQATDTAEDPLPAVEPEPASDAGPDLDPDSDLDLDLDLDLDRDSGDAPLRPEPVAEVGPPPTLEPGPAPEPDPDQASPLTPDPGPAAGPLTEGPGPRADPTDTGLAARLARLDSSMTGDVRFEADPAAEVDDMPAVPLDEIPAPADPPWFDDAPVTVDPRVRGGPGNAGLPVDDPDDTPGSAYGYHPPPEPGASGNPADGDDPTFGEPGAVPIPTGGGAYVTDSTRPDSAAGGAALLPVPQDGKGQERGNNRTAMLVLGSLVVLAVCVVLAVVVLGGGDDDGIQEDQTADRGDLPTPTVDDPIEDSDAGDVSEEEQPAGEEGEATDGDGGEDDGGDDTEGRDQDGSELPVPTDLRVEVNTAGVQLTWEAGGNDSYDGPFLLLMLSEQDRPRTQSVDSTSHLIPVDLGDDNGYCFGVARADVVAQVAPGEGERVGDYEVGTAFSEMSCIRGATEDTVRTE